MGPGKRAIPRAPSTRRKTQRPPDAPDVPPLVAKAAGDLIALASAIRDCEVCGGPDARFAFGSGFPRAPVMLVAERPTDDDLEAGAVFTAEADALDKAFSALQIPLSWVYGTSVVRSDAGRPCPEHLLAEIEAVEPVVLVAFGPRAIDGIRSLEGKCGIAVPDATPQGEAIGLRPGLVLIGTEPLREGVNHPDAKRRLWRDLQGIPALIGPHR